MALTRPSGSEIKYVLSLVENADKWISDVVAEEKTQRGKIIKALDRLSEAQAAKILDEMDIDCLNASKQGFRLSALRNAGIHTMGKLCSMSRNKIVNVHGIGEDNALLIYSAARKIENDVRSGIKVRLSVDDKSSDAAELICALSFFVENSAVVRRCNELYYEYHDSIYGAGRAVNAAKKALKWLFLSAEKRASALEALDYLRGLIDGEFGKTVSGLIERYDRYKAPDAQKCWADFEQRSAAYYAELEKLDKSAARRLDNSRCGLPNELAEAVEKEPVYASGLNATLRSYQEFGVKYILRQGNVLLGDEMGLGKTVQAIAAMVSLAEMGATHFLVVCPASVTVNWSREIKQFSDFEVTIIRGGDFRAVNTWVERGGVAVTTYDSISRFGLPEGFEFSMLVADEAHYVKNPLAKRSQYLKVISRRADRILFMTGTPLENRVDEMCHIVRFLNETVANEINDLKYISSAPQFREALAPVYLRRTREDVLQELPELIEKEQWCDMGLEESKRYYLSVMSNNFMAMRQVSWDVKDINKSSKARRLIQLMEMAEEEGRKVIIFSFFRDTIDRVCALLGSKAMEPITGSVSAVKRQEIIDEFGKAPNGTALVCQIQAGGTGLNIQTASVIIFCEPQIKPSLETQAISRVYRMGQVRNVLVHRLLCDNTVDERIMELLRDKQDIFDNFADESAVGSEYVKNEQMTVKALVEAEKKRLEAGEEEI